MNTHSHSLPSAFDRAFGLGIALNISFALVEVFYGFMANSLALLADAGHNVSDVLGLLMAWGASLLARRPPSSRFTYGLQSVSILAATANALLLMIVVGGIGWEAAQRLQHPEMPATATVMVVAAAGVLVNGATAWLFHKGQHDLNIRGAFLHMMGDAAISLGVMIAGALIMLTGWLWLDSIVSLFIVLFIFLATWSLLKGSLSLAMHAVPKDIDADAVRSYLTGLQGVSEVHDLHIWAMGTTGVAMSAHVLMPGGHPGDAFLQQATHELETRFRIVHSTLQIEVSGEHCHSGCAHE